MTSFMGEWDEGSQTNLSAIVSNSFILKYSMCCRAIFGGVCPKPHHKLAFRRKTYLSICTIEKSFSTIIVIWRGTQRRDNKNT